MLPCAPPTPPEKPFCGGSLCFHWTTLSSREYRRADPLEEPGLQHSLKPVPGPRPAVRPRLAGSARPGLGSLGPGGSAGAGHRHLSAQVLHAPYPSQPQPGLQGGGTGQSEHSPGGLTPGTRGQLRAPVRRVWILGCLGSRQQLRARGAVCEPGQQVGLLCASLFKSDAPIFPFVLNSPLTFCAAVKQLLPPASEQAEGGAAARITTHSPGRVRPGGHGSVGPVSALCRTQGRVGHALP